MRFPGEAPHLKDLAVRGCRGNQTVCCPSDQGRRRGIEDIVRHARAIGVAIVNVSLAAPLTCCVGGGLVEAIPGLICRVRQASVHQAMKSFTAIKIVA
jgi:hypothetical protein